MTQLLTVAEVAAMLRVSRATVYRLVRNAALPVVKIGADMRIDPADVERWLESRKVFA